MWLWAGVSLLVARSVAAEATASALPTGRPPLEMGGLHRAAASLEIVLDVYRLALLELEPAARRVVEAGHDREATTATPVPEPAREVFGRLATALASRTPVSALPVISRAYHAEVIDALEQLAGAEALPATVAPLRALTQAMAHVCDGGDAMVDLFSRQRPIQVKLVDPATTMDEIAEALDEVAEAERGIAEVRVRKAPMRDALHAFERLEVSLGHALDLIAAADEAGLHIGFEAPRTTADFARLTARVREQLAVLQQVLKAFDAKPPAIPSSVVAVLVPTKPGEVEARLSWPAIEQGPAPAGIRLYRQHNLKALMERLAWSFQCGGKDAQSAMLAAEAEVAQVSSVPVRVADLPPGRSGFTEALGETPLCAPRYTLVTVNSYGVESDPVEAEVVYLPPVAEGVPLVTARALAPTAEHPDFYEFYDQVEVAWPASANDPSRSRSALAKVAEPVTLNSATGYRVTRVVAGVPHIMATLPVGTVLYRDRLPPEALAATSLSYRVETLFAGDQAILPPSSCAERSVTLDPVRTRLAQAKAGLGALVRPSYWERERRQRYEQDSVFAPEHAAFMALPLDTRVARISAWWQGVSEPERRRWLGRWPSFVPESEREAWLAETPQYLAAKDLPWVRLEAFLMDQPEEVRHEVDRFWSLLDGSARAEAVRLWETQLSHGQRLELYGKRGENGGGDWQVSRPARVLAWWRSRDVKEQQRVVEWWSALGDGDRHLRISTWLATLSEPTRLALRWPDFDKRPPAEQAALVADAWQQLPGGLLKEALVGIAWQQLVEAGGEPLTRVLAQEIPAWRRAWVAGRYATRPWDLALGFHLLGFVTAGLLLLVALVLVWRRRR